jgi:hypothetical protein
MCTLIQWVCIGWVGGRHTTRSSAGIHPRTRDGRESARPRLSAGGKGGRVVGKPLARDTSSDFAMLPPPAQSLGSSGALGVDCIVHIFAGSGRYILINWLAGRSRSEMGMLITGFAQFCARECFAFELRGGVLLIHAHSTGLTDSPACVRPPFCVFEPIPGGDCCARRCTASEPWWACICLGANRMALWPRGGDAYSLLASPCI